MTMDPRFTFRNIDSTDGLKSHTLAKLTKLDKHIQKPVGMHVVFNVEHLDHIVEITLAANGNQYIVSNKSDNMYVSIDGAINKLQSQLKKDRDRIKKHKGE